MSTLHVAIDAWKRLWEKGKGKKTNEKSKKQSKKTIRRGKRETLKHYYQRSMQGENQDAADVEEFGERMQAKRDDVFRVGLQNITNLSKKRMYQKAVK
jgi:hypothetical protein